MTSSTDRPPFDTWFPDAAFDASYGYDLPTLETIEPPEAPPDFDDFWTGMLRRAVEIDPMPEVASPERHGDVDIAPVRLTSWGGVRIGGWFTRPSTGPIRRGLIIGHGYGGRAQPDLSELPPETAALFMVARGLPELSLLPGVPSTGHAHVLHGIESRDRYIHGGCVADVWCAATALRQLMPGLPGPLGYIGGSFGGGIGALAMPWDDRFGAAAFQVPSFGHHDLRLSMQCVGSGESVRQYAADHPEVRDVLAYFDAATAATRLRIPVVMGPALWDPAVPPPGQFAVVNAVPGHVERFVFSAGHAEYPGDEEELDDYQHLTARFFTEHLDGEPRLP